MRRSVERIQRRWQTPQTREPAGDGSEQNTFGPHIELQLALNRNTYNYGWRSHMGQIPQDGNFGQNVAFF